MGKSVIFLILLFCLVSCSSSGEDAQPQQSQQIQPADQPQSQSEQQLQDEEVAGVLFDVPVPMNNFYFAMRTALMFGTPWGGMPRTVEKLEERTWDDLLLSYEAFRRNITVSDEELEAEISKNLKGYKVEFDWKQDKKAYEEWAQNTLNEPTTLFENQMRHLVQLKKLQQEVLDSFDPAVTEEEAHQEFLNEHNTLSVELVQFDELKDAEEFYQKVKDDPDAWEKEKEANPDSFKAPGFVALEFLMHMWKFQFDAVYDMIEMEIGSIYPPSPIYKGHGVFKVLEIRRAKEEDFTKRKESYYNQLKHRKRYEGFYEWLADLKEQADIMIFAKPPEGLFPESNQ